MPLRPGAPLGRRRLLPAGLLEHLAHRGAGEPRAFRSSAGRPSLYLARFLGADFVEKARGRARSNYAHPPRTLVGSSRPTGRLAPTPSRAGGDQGEAAFTAVGGGGFHRRGGAAFTAALSTAQRAHHVDDHALRDDLI